MKAENVGEFLVVGNDEHALVIDAKTLQDAWFFAKQAHDYINPTALLRARKWAQPGVAAAGRPRPDWSYQPNKFVGEYSIVGNVSFAVAIHQDTREVHWFSAGRADPNYGETYMTAFERAETWASPGE